MASTLKIDTITTPDGTGNITVSRPLSGSGASLTSLPAANLTGTLPAINGSSLTGISAQKNIIINGDFEYWQRGTSFAACGDNEYQADRFKYKRTGAMRHTISRDTDVPTVAESGHLSAHSLKVDCTTIDSSIATTDNSRIEHHIEGYNFRYLAQKAMTLSFWHKHTKTGIYCVTFINGGNDKSYVVEYTQTTTDTWEKATINIPASPSGGTWNYTTGTGIVVAFTLASGTFYHTTADAWQTGQYIATSSQVNACDNTSNNFMLAQVQLEAGSVATDFEIKNHTDEFARCQRYFQTSYAYGTIGATTREGQKQVVFTGMNTAVHENKLHVDFPVYMRTVPTIVLYDYTGTTGYVEGPGSPAGSTSNRGTSGFTGQATMTSASYIQIGFHYTAAAEL